MIKFLILLIVLAAGGGYFYPQWHEQAPGPCGALEKRLEALVHEQVSKMPQPANPRVAAMLGAVQNALPSGNLAIAYVRERFPAIPPELACAAAYWKTVIDPDLTTIARNALPVLAPK